MVGKRAPLSLELLDVPVAVRCPDAELRARLELCYGRSRVEAPRGQPVAASLEPAEDGWRVRVAGRPERRELDAVAAVRTFNHELLHGVMLAAPELFYVHAGVVELDGHGLVLPGLSRAGKSTLVVAALAAGARLVSDELLAFDRRTGRGLAFPRAPKIRDACVGYFPALAAHFRGRGEGRFLPFEHLPGPGIAASTRVSAVVVPRWEGGAESRLEPLSRGAALLELAASSLNFGTHRARSLDHLAALVAEARTFRLAWRDPHEAVAMVRGAIG